MQYWFKLLYKTQGKRISVGVFLAFFTAFSGLSLLMLSGWFITATALAGIAIASGIIIVFDMYMPGSGIRFFALSSTVGRYLERLYNHDTILRLVSVFRVKLFKSLSGLAMFELRNTSDTEWLSRLTADLDALDSLLLRFTITPIVTVLIIFCVAVFTSFIWPTLALVLAVFLLGCSIFIITLTIQSTKSLGAKGASLLNALRQQVIVHLQGRFELKSQHLLQAHERHILRELESLDAVQSAIDSRIANIQLLLDILLMIGLCTLAVICLYSAQTGIIDGPIAVMFVLMFVGVSELIQVIPTQYKEWGRTHYSANRLEPKNGQVNHPNSKVVQSVELLDITIDKHPQITASQKETISISIDKTQTVLITGRSGTGKSTIANIIAGVSDEVSRNVCENTTVRVNGQIQDSNSEYTRSFANIGYLTQSNSVLAGSLVYNLLIGLDNILEEQVWRVLQMVELDKWAQALDEGLNTWLGDTGEKVSGGQARRITLARLLLRDPELVVFDEPFNGLDAAMGARIWQNISPWLNKRKVVLLTHEYPHYLIGKDDTIHIALSD
jgi:ATP-binding cassette subfamily C protein CydC